MRRPRVLRRLLVAALAALLAATSPLLAAVPGAAATPGVWGVQQATYVDGTVCSNAGTTSPLASWNFGDPSLDFLLTSVTSTGVSDSALLPQAGAPGRTVAPLTPGQFGMAQTDIATFAALISLLGSGPDPDAAETASAILQTSDPGAVPTCVPAAAAQALEAQAAHLAGPYTITVTPATSPVQAGAASSVTVRVTNAQGQPVPNVAVTLSSTAPLFNGGTAAAGRTGGTGLAQVSFTAPQDPTLTSATITASAAVSVGLEAVTVSADAGQQYASAVYADPPTTFQGSVSLPVSQGAKPVLTSKLSTTAISTGTSLSLAVELTGMFGHAGQATFSVAGPLKLDPSKLCGGLGPASFRGAGAAAHSQVSVVGDSDLTGGQWQPSAAGCYLFSSAVITSNATPQASANGPPTVITVVDTTAAATPDHSVIGPAGQVTTTVQVAHSYQRAGALATTLVGPITPGDGNCVGADWSKAPTAALPVAKTAGDGSYAVTTGPLRKVGCYQLHSALQLAVSPTATATVPFTFANPAGIVYVLSPTVSAAADVTSVASPATVNASVTVQNTFGQSGHVTLQMYQVPDDEFACRRADFGHAALLGEGPPAAITGDGSVDVTSGPTPKLGCYALVPKLVMDANASVVATGSPNTSDTVLAGVGLTPPPPRQVARASQSLLGTYITLAVFLLLLMITALGVFRYVNRAYAHEGEDEDRRSPIGSRLAGLFADRG